MLLGAALQMMLSPYDRRVVAEEWNDEAAVFGPPMLDLLVSSEDITLQSYAGPWWPGHGNVLSGQDDALVDLLQVPPMYQDYYPVSGANGRLAFVGITRDAYGSPLGTVAVKCFRTATDELVSSIVSDASSGYYIATTPYYEAHYLVTQKAAAIPPVAGASIDTLLPA